MGEPSGLHGEFRLLHKIGEGGMADVFLAERLGDDGFRTRVALKRLHRGLAMDTYFIRQLVREARLLGQLEHANIVRVFDLRRIGDEYYVVMEYVDGIDLAAVVKVHRSRKTRIPRPFFFHVALSLAEALSYAHSAVDDRGQPTPLIHRDIKPSNVMLSRRGIVKLTDFGIAHVGDGSITGGLVQGTANYMSPEQAFGEDRLTPASDVYSLGSVFYEMLTGRPLVQGDNYLKAIHQVRERRVTLEELASLGVEPGLRMVIAKMLSADLAGRYTEMDSVRNDLQFVADRLKIDLSWHRIRAYVGRLMGLLGRAPGRATLSGIKVHDEIRVAALVDSQPPPEPPRPSGPVTPATPPPVRRPVPETGVTKAVRKDILEAALRPATAPPAPPLPPSTARPALPGDASDADHTVAMPGPLARAIATGEHSAVEVSGEATVAMPSGSVPVARPLGAPSPAPADVAPVEGGWDEDRTRVFAGPSPREAGVVGTGLQSPLVGPAPPAPVGTSELPSIDLVAAPAPAAVVPHPPPPPAYPAHAAPPSGGSVSGWSRGPTEGSRTDPGYQPEEEETLPPTGVPAPLGQATTPPTPFPARAEPPRRPKRARKRRRKKKRPVSPVVLALLVVTILCVLFAVFAYVWRMRAEAVSQRAGNIEVVARVDDRAPAGPRRGILPRHSPVPTVPRLT